MYQLQTWEIHKEMRQSLRRSVLRRDGYKCVQCKSTENLTVHHVKGQAVRPDEKYNPNNGVTLCQKCHVETEKLRQQKKVHSENRVIIFN